MVGRLLVFLQILLLSNPFCGTFMDVANYCAPDSGAEYCDERVCLSLCVSVCVFVRDHIFGNARPIFTKFLCILPMAVARSSSAGVVICNVLPVLWMTSYLLYNNII